MNLLIIFLCGIGNFAMHRAMMESDQPMIAEARSGFTRALGRYGSYILEFIMLAAALIFANMGSMTALLFYSLYTIVNGLGAYFLFVRK